MNSDIDKQNGFLKNLLHYTFLSSFSDSFFFLILLVYTTSTTQNPILISLVTLSEMIPYVFSSFLGVLADKVNKRRAALYLSVLVRSISYVIVFVLLFLTIDVSIESIIVCIVIINVVSDSFGKFSGSLLLPYIQDQFQGDEMEKAQGLHGAIGQSGIVLGNIIGGILYSYVPIAFLPLINVGAFLLLIIVISKIEKFISLDSKAVDNGLNSFLKQFVSSLRPIKQNKTVIFLLFLIGGINGSLGVILPLFLQVEIKNSLPFLISSIQIVLVICVIIGNILSFKILKQVSLDALIKMCYFTTLIVLVCISKMSLIPFFITLCFLGLFVGAMMPKLNSRIMEEFERTAIAGVAGTITTILMIFPTLFAAILSVLSGSVETQGIIVMLFSYVSLMLLLSFAAKRKKPVE